MSPTPLALVILLLGTLHAVAATLGPEVPAPAERTRGLERATEQVAPQPPFLRAPAFAAGMLALTPWHEASSQQPAAPHAALPSGANVAQVPLPGAMPLLLGALAVFAILGRRRTRPPGGT